MGKHDNEATNAAAKSDLNNPVDKQSVYRIQISTKINTTTQARSQDFISDGAQEISMGLGLFI